jgi:hypothetical protein
MWVDESAFERAAVEARTIQEQTGFLPALDDPRLKAREILSWSRSREMGQSTAYSDCTGRRTMQRGLSSLPRCIR